MSRRRALVVHTRMPAFDRDSGSQDIDNTVRFLLDAGWSVTFLAQEEAGVAEARHAQRLRSMGVATHTGFGAAERLIRSDDFDLALIAFWELASKLLPLLRTHSPRTRVIVNSMDVHFLRHARASFGQSRDLDHSFGTDTVRELNVYNEADAVIAVSDKERALLADFLGDDRVFTVPLAEHIERSTVPLRDRRGMLFLANFRHEPNREAVRYLCGEVLPLLDRDLLEQHPLTVIGNWLAEANLDIDERIPGVRMVGWVPSVKPYLDRTRISVVPLLHGAGVKRKVLQSMMAYTPVATTPVGAESLDLTQGEHALIAADSADLASAITRLLTDDDVWNRLAANGAAHATARHDAEVVRRRFDDIVERVMARPPRLRRAADDKGRKYTGVDDDTAAEVRARVRMFGDPGAVVLVASGGDEALVDLGSQRGWHFPQGRDGGWAGYEPVDGPAAINHLEAQRARGARYFVLPKSAFSWRFKFHELIDHLELRARRVHQDEHLIAYDLAPAAPAFALAPNSVVRVQVFGTYSAERTGPPTAIVTELGRSAHVRVDQQWRSDLEIDEAGFDAALASTDADYVVFVRDNAVLPSRFVDELIATQVELGVDRLQPTHVSGPEGGPPIIERSKGTIAREVDALTPLPVLSIRAGVPPMGP